jgi:hypothetical protein
VITFYLVFLNLKLWQLKKDLYNKKENMMKKTEKNEM